MITRIVKMVFHKDKLDQFLELFDSKSDRIRHFPGCTHLELLADVNESGIFFTYSKWESELDLNNYRDSDLFKDTWKITKTFFREKPQAWSVKSQRKPD